MHYHVSSTAHSTAQHFCVRPCDGQHVFWACHYMQCIKLTVMMREDDSNGSPVDQRLCTKLRDCLLIGAVPVYLQQFPLSLTCPGRLALIARGPIFSGKLSVATFHMSLTYSINIKGYPTAQQLNSLEHFCK